MYAVLPPRFPGLHREAPSTVLRLPVHTQGVHTEPRQRSPSLGCRGAGDRTEPGATEAAAGGKSPTPRALQPRGRSHCGALQSRKQRKDTVNLVSWNYPLVYRDTF